MIQRHELKTGPIYFDAVANRVKLFEVRRNARAFQKGDLLKLVRHDGHSYRPSDIYGCELHARITYLLQGGQFGIEPGYCVLGIEIISREEYEK